MAQINKKQKIEHLKKELKIIKSKEEEIEKQQRKLNVQREDMMGFLIQHVEATYL